MNDKASIKTICFHAGPAENGDVYCETEAFNASCELGSAILMTHARYGRMRLSRCVRHDYGHVGCASDVIDLVDTRCSARRRCSIRVPDALLATRKPCPDDLKPYLEARYICVKGRPMLSRYTARNRLRITMTIEIVVKIYKSAKILVKSKATKKTESGPQKRRSNLHSVECNSTMWRFLSG